MQILLDLFLLGRLEHSVEDSVITNKSNVLHVLFNNNFEKWLQIEVNDWALNSKKQLIIQESLIQNNVYLIMEEKYLVQKQHKNEN